MDGACQLTFIKQAVKQQITGLYGFIIQGTLNHSGGARFSCVWGACTIPSVQPSTERADRAFSESKKREREVEWLSLFSKR